MAPRCCLTAPVTQPLERVVPHRVEQRVARVAAETTETIDLSTRASSRWVTVASSSPWLPPTATSEGSELRPGVPRPGAATSSRPRAAGRSSTPRGWIAPASERLVVEQRQAALDQRLQLKRGRHVHAPPPVRSQAAGRPRAVRWRRSPSCLRVQLEARPSGARPLDEGFRPPASRHRPRCPRPEPKVSDRDLRLRRRGDLATRRQHAHAGTSLEQRLDHEPHLAEQVFARVKQDDRPRGAQPPDQLIAATASTAGRSRVTSRGPIARVRSTRRRRKPVEAAGRPRERLASCRRPAARSASRSGAR